jgi:putative flippase GtrA
VGGFATAVDMGVFYLAANIVHIHYLVANTISFSFGLFISYFLSREWVFSRKSHKFARDFILFTITSLIGLLISNLVLYFLIDRNGLKELLSWLQPINEDTIKMIAKIVASFIVLVWNFITKNFIVFKNS